MGPRAGVDYITSPYVHSKVDSKTFTMGIYMPESTLTLQYARVDFIPQSGTLDLASGQINIVLLAHTTYCTEAKILVILCTCI